MILCNTVKRGQQRGHAFVLVFNRIERPPVPHQIQALIDDQPHKPRYGQEEPV